MRYAIYYTPELDDPLTRLAEQWLGRSAFGRDVPALAGIDSFSAAEMAFHTAAPRRYAFHATIKAPFRLAAGRGESELISALDAFAAARRPISQPVRLAQIDGFFALVPEGPATELNRLADDVISSFEPFRAPLDAAEIERRNPENLTPGQLKNLHKWGYPYVFEEFRFHMTLTGRVPAAETARMERAIEGFFGPMLLEPLDISSLALFVEPEPGAPFHVRSLHAIGRAKERKSA